MRIAHERTASASRCFCPPRASPRARDAFSSSCTSLMTSSAAAAPEELLNKRTFSRTVSFSPAAFLKLDSE